MSAGTNRLVLAICLWVALAQHALLAQSGRASDSSLTKPGYRLRILGLFDERSGEPIEGVDVSDVLTGTTTRSTSTGTVSLAFLPDGGGLVRIRKLGYAMQTMMVSISPADSLPITVLLSRATELPAVVTVDSAPRYASPALRAFEERRRNAASGFFIPEAVVRKEEARNIGDFFRAHIPNVIIREGPGGSVYLMRSPRCGSGGPPAVYLDGVLLSPDSPGGPVNLSLVRLTDVAGVEYYANTATAPSEFNRTLSSCGALLFWTRER